VREGSGLTLLTFASGQPQTLRHQRLGDNTTIVRPSNVNKVKPDPLVFNTMEEFEFLRTVATWIREHRVKPTTSTDS
jgi:hypothetical protein